MQHLISNYGEEDVEDEEVSTEDLLHRRVARLMRLAGLRGCPKRRFKVMTERDPSHPVAQNLINQEFEADVPNQRWAADITFISTHKG